jgi:hypothetical protein
LEHYHSSWIIFLYTTKISIKQSGLSPESFYQLKNNSTWITNLLWVSFLYRWNKIPVNFLMSSTWVNQYFVKFKERCQGGIHQSYRKKLSYGTPWGVPPPLPWCL